MSERERQGSILIIVVGLAALLLTSFLVVTRQLRGETDDGVILMRDTQARMMLPAAMAFILESARLGQHVHGECFGWTDIRDGGIGPRTARQRNASSLPSFSPSANDEHSRDNWPAPGSHYRTDMRLWQRPPLAVRHTRAYNPIQAPAEWLEDYELAQDRSQTLLWQMLRPQVGIGGLGFLPPNPPDVQDSNRSRIYWTTGTGGTATLTDKGLEKHWGYVWDLVYQPLEQADPSYHHALSPQPVAHNLGDFRSGDPRTRLGSQDLGWFRIYREAAADHDGLGGPWFDTIALIGHGTFIVTCGAGGTRGYRDWSEVVAFGAADQFMNDQDFFEELRAGERIHWYRLQWSAATGGGLSAYEHMDMGISGRSSNGPMDHYLRSFTALMAHQRAKYSDTGYWQSYTTNSPIPLLNTTGTIAWIDKLEREPVDDSGDPLW